MRLPKQVAKTRVSFPLFLMGGKRHNSSPVREELRKILKQESKHEEEEYQEDPDYKVLYSAIPTTS